MFKKPFKIPHGTYFLKWKAGTLPADHYLVSDHCDGWLEVRRLGVETLVYAHETDLVFAATGGNEDKLLRQKYRNTRYTGFDRNGETVADADLVGDKWVCRKWKKSSPISVAVEFSKEFDNEDAAIAFLKDVGSVTVSHFGKTC